MGTVLSGAAFAHAQAVTATDADVTASNTSTCGPGTNCIENGGTSPTAASTSGALLRDGVFGCSASKYQNIGSLSAVGGVYVPVNDAAVTLNTGYLVYKECVLDGVVSAIRNDAVAGLQQQVLKAAETGRGGKAQYLKNFEEDLRPYFDAITVNIITDARSGTMCNAFKNNVTSAYARNYYQTTRGSNSVLSCSFASDAERNAIVSGTGPVNWGNWMNFVDPRGYEMGQYYLLENKTEAAVARYNEDIRQMLSWGRGVFPALDNAQNPLGQHVLTPGYIIADSLSQMIGAGTQILLSANEIDQVNGQFQAALSSTIVTDTIRGLSGLTKSQNGQPSYIDRMTAEASAAVRSGAVNAAISILSTARQVETQYKAAKEATATALTAAITTLSGYESQCWNLVVPKVQEYAASQGTSITIATSTQFSRAIIDGQIAPLASTTITDLRASEKALALINQLIASVTNSSSATNQRVALEQLDSMVANNQLHSSSDAQIAQKQKDDVTSALTILTDDTKTAWADSTDPNIGWCNINNPDVITMWFNKWR